ncbi:aldehyde ferredoxin oxidoreductase family protein [Chloroflexota bacterium]
MANGYCEKVLLVDLSSGSIKEKHISEKIYREFIGSYGLGARILYENMKPKVDPLSPDNVLGFVVGPLTDTGIHGSRYQVIAKSPLTGGWGDANSGGSFAAELKRAGYDGVFFSGASPKPAYLFLNEGRAELRDATHIWGKDTIETEDRIRHELADNRVRVACIGPAGEKQSLLSAVMHENCAAARSGLGAVMGSKRLKAFAARGDNKVTIAKPEAFAALRKAYLKDVKQSDHPFLEMLKNWGTCSFVSSCVEKADSPIKNWTLFGEAGFPNHKKLNGDAVTKYQIRKHACLGCPTGCKGWLKVEKGPYAMSKAGKPEYETLGMLGVNCLIDDVEAIIKANDLCNRYGLDTIGTGSAIAFAMECYDRGLITKEETDGIELLWGNSRAMISMVEKIGRREGFGNVLADGSKRAAERIGKDSERWAAQVGGQDLPAHDGRAGISFGWGYVCDPTPGRHTVTTAMITREWGGEFTSYPELKFPEMDPLDIKANAEIYATLCDYERLFWSAGLCQFALWGSFPLIEAISAVTGWDFSLPEGLKAGRRIQTLRQAFNFREGLDLGKWKLPARQQSMPTTGPTAGRKVDFEDMKEKGYSALGWDNRTGKPLNSTLDYLALREIVGEL